MIDATSFWDRAAPKYARSTISDIAGYRATLDRTISHLNATDRVLELGCGTASTALELAPHVAHVTATDISPAMIEIGREKAREADVGNVTLFAAPAGDAGLAGHGPFEAVLALNLLHLLPNQEEVLAQVHGLLKPGGLMISKTACLGERWFFKPMVGMMRMIGKAPFVTHQKIDDLRRAILVAGFEPVEALTQSGTPPRLYMVARKVDVEGHPSPL